MLSQAPLSKTHPLLAVTLLLVPFVATHADVRKKLAVNDYELPKGAKQPVIVLDYQGGFTPPRKNNDPTLRIFADGSVVTGAPFGMKKVVRGNISAERIQALLRFILEEQKLADFDAAKVQREIEASSEVRFGIEDAATTVIRVHVVGKEYEKKYYALDHYARRYPKIKQLAQLDAIRAKLSDLLAEINAGGEKEIAKHLTRINAELRKQNPEVPALSPADLQSAFVRANGEHFIAFNRREQLNGSTRTTTGTVRLGPGDQQSVSVRVTTRSP